MIQELLFVWLAHRKLIGVPLEPDRPEAGRLGKAEIKTLVRDMRKTARELIGAAQLKQLKSHGNRFNASLGLYHVSLYRSLCRQGLADDYAIQLAREIGWSFYAATTRYYYWLIRPFVWNKQKQINTILRLLMLFPFNRDPKGYQFQIKNEVDHLRTDWTQCVVFEAIKRVGNDQDLNFFRNSWCQYDYKFPALISKDGHYEREHTLSSGDPVCDMKWYAHKPGE